MHTLNHNYVIDRVFQAHIEGRDHGYSARNTAEPPPFEELRRAQHALDNWYVEWSDTVTVETLGKPIDFTFIGGGAGRMTPAEMVLHIVNHTSYHRGFAGDLFFQVPARPPTTDLTVFLRDAAPDPACGGRTRIAAPRTPPCPERSTMFGSDILEVAIGLSLIYLLMSALCSACRSLSSDWSSSSVRTRRRRRPRWPTDSGCRDARSSTA